jgi:anion-transporting  ArsA/GET3 family ATPase
VSLLDLVDQHRIVVCVGSGGVGKTTIAASLALYGALHGRRSMVLTIDPARRLAQSLGVGTLASGGEAVDLSSLEGFGAGLQVGSLAAGMLDREGAWDEFIARHAPNEEVAATIRANTFYQHLSRSFAGSTEYMAMEELGRIDESGLYDLIVLDTPPSRHALDFLEAPQRLSEFLDRRVAGWLAGPSRSAVSVGWSAWKQASRGARFLLRRIEDATGISTLNDISEFFVAMEKLFDGIGERSERVQALLRARRTAFVLVAGSEEQVLGEAEDLSERMRDLEMPLKGVVMNRVHHVPDAAESEVTEKLALLAARLKADGVDGQAWDWVEGAFVSYLACAAAEEARRELFTLGLGPDVELAAVPELPGDVHDLTGLTEVVKLLQDS